MKPFPLVVEFMRAFGQRVPDSLEMPDEATKTLRARLDKEERRELDEANNLAEYLDAVCDSLYVTMGAAAAAGFTSETIAEAFWEVHRSNMSKLWTHEEVQQVRMGENITSLGAMTAAEFDNRYDVTRAVVEHGTDRCLIVKRKDGKVIKSPGYSPANLWPIIRRDSAVKESSTTDHSEGLLEKVAKLEAANRELVELLAAMQKPISDECHLALSRDHLRLTNANRELVEALEELLEFKSKTATRVMEAQDAARAILAKHKGAK